MDEPRRLYRDPKRAMIGGVCVGLADYLRVDPTVVRAGFALLAVAGIFLRGISTFFVVVAYVVLWFVVPPRPEDKPPVGAPESPPWRGD